MIYWLGKLFLGCIAKAFFGYNVVGHDKRIESGGAIIASNHASFMDPPLVGVAYNGDIHYLARSTLFQGFFSWLLPRWNAVPVDRDAADLKSMKTILRTLKEGKRVLMFPEGTRSEDGSLLPAKPGVGMLIAKGQVPVGRPRGVEPARVLELRGVVIGADVVDHHPVALPDELPAHLDVLSGGAHEVLHRAGPADRLFDDTG